MNKLEEYKQKRMEGYDNSLSSMAEAAWMPQGFEEGFDAAIALDLPLKFTRWKDMWYLQLPNGRFWFNIPENKNKGVKDLETFSYEELYQYWIDNVLKIE